MLIVPAIAALLLAGCAEDGASGSGATAIGPFKDYSGIGLYDGFYGPFYGGYWGADGSFWYLDSAHAWHRDVDGHFRHNSMLGDNHL
jgi:hypothetical protein